MYGFGSNNTTYQPPPPLQHTDAAYREAIARQQAQYDAFARAHQQQAQQQAQRQTDIHQQLFQETAADAQRRAQQDAQFMQDFLRAGGGGTGGRMPETFHNFGRDSDDEDDLMSRSRMDVDSTGPAFPQANIPSFPQPTYTTAPAAPPSFPTPQQQQSTSSYPYPQPGRSRQQPSLRTQHEAATRIQRFWRNFLWLRTWRRNASLHQLALLRRKFDGLVSEFAPPPTLAYAPTPDAAEINVSTSPVPYTSFVRLSSEVLSTMGRAPPLSFNASMKPIHATSEEFVRVLGKLDAVNSWGDPKVREARKSLAGAVEGEASRLDSWVKVVWFSRDGREAPGMPKPETMGGMPTFPEPTRMPQPQNETMQNEQQAWEQELQSRERRKSYQPPPGPPPSQTQPQTWTQEHPSLRQLSDLRAQFASIKAEFAVPEILEYTLQPARSMSNGLELIARLETSFLSYHAFSPPRSSAQLPTSTAKSYSGPPLAFSSTNKPVHSYNEALLQMLGKLDAVESGGDARVRDARKGLAGDVEGEAGRLEGWWKEAWVLRGGEAEVVKVRT